MHNARIYFGNNLHLLDNSVVAVRVMQCFCTGVCCYVCFLFLFFCVSVYVFFLFYGSSWSDSNKQRKKEEKKLN